MSLLIKICGLKSPDAIDVAIECGADMVGFVFFPSSPRHLGFESARALGERVRKRALKVALSVDAGDEELDAIIAALRPDLLQLHGHETPVRVRAVRERFGLPVIKALPIAERGDLFAHMHHASARQHFLVGRIARRLHEAVLDALGVVDRDDRLDARQGGGFRRVDPHDAGMRMRRSHEGNVSHAWKAEVAHVLGAPLRQPPEIGPWD